MAVCPIGAAQFGKASWSVVVVEMNKKIFNYNHLPIKLPAQQGFASETLGAQQRRWTGYTQWWSEYARRWKIRVPGWTPQ
jgi:hypothetical protein